MRGGDPGPVVLEPHVDGLMHGLWRILHADGSVEEGRYGHERLHGPWVGGASGVDRLIAVLDGLPGTGRGLPQGR